MFKYIKEIDFMNFKTWFKSYSENLDDSPPLDLLAEDSWNACKEEVLKIIHKNPNSVAVSFTEIIKEIQKL